MQVSEAWPRPPRVHGDRVEARADGENSRTPPRQERLHQAVTNGGSRSQQSSIPTSECRQWVFLSPICRVSGRTA